MSVKYHQRTEDAHQLIPPRGYTDARYFELEQDLLFGRTWMYAGMVDDVLQPGDYLTVQAGRFPLAIVRGQDGKLRAFHNLCRHRGTQFLEGCGNSERGLQCPYHKWFYELDGRLKAVPREDLLFPSVRKEDLGLMPASLGEFRGMLFIHPDENPNESWSDFCADLELKVGPHHPDKMVETGRSRHLFPANWKLVAENYMDAYHLFYLHERSAATFDHERFDWDTAGRHFLFYEPVVEKYKDWADKVYGDKYLGVVPGTDPETYGGTFHMLFPTIGWVGMAHSWSTFHIIPQSVDSTIVESRVRVMPEAQEAMKASRRYEERFNKGDDAVVTLADCPTHPTESDNLMFEDMWACQQMQRAMGSPAYQVGAMARTFESTMTFYQRNILDFVSYSANEETL